MEYKSSEKKNEIYKKGKNYTNKKIKAKIILIKKLWKKITPMKDQSSSKTMESLKNLFMKLHEALKAINTKRLSMH